MHNNTKTTTFSVKKGYTHNSTKRKTFSVQKGHTYTTTKTTTFSIKKGTHETVNTFSVKKTYKTKKQQHLV